MRTFSRIKNEFGTVAKIDADFILDDERLARQWKKRCIAYQNSSKASKDIIKNNNQENDTDMASITIDSDYENFLNDMDESVVADDVDSIDDHVNCDVALTFDSDYEKFLNDMDRLVADEVDSVDYHNVNCDVSLTPDSDYENFLNDMDQNFSQFVADDLDSVDDNANCDVPRTLERSYDGDIVDPQYTMLLDNLKEDGNSYVLTLPFGDDMPLVVKYEKKDDNVPRRKNKEAQDKLRNNKSSSTVPMTDRKVPVVEKNVELETHTIFHCPTNDCVSDMMDESYQVFLNFLEDDGQNFVYAPEGGEKVVYEKDVGDSDSEVVILDANSFPDGENDPFESSEPYFSCEVRKLSSETSLWKFFKKPYDHKELKHLMQEASRQRPLEKRCLVLRGREVMYRLRGSFGKSYLDEYSDLARKIDEVDDHPRVLNLLRGLFYWLQHLSHEGAFRPWLDASCLEALPRL